MLTTMVIAFAFLFLINCRFSFKIVWHPWLLHILCSYANLTREHTSKRVLDVNNNKKKLQKKSKNKHRMKTEMFDCSTFCFRFCFCLLFTFNFGVARLFGIACNVYYFQLLWL